LLQIYNAGVLKKIGKSKNKIFKGKLEFSKKYILDILDIDNDGRASQRSGLTLNAAAVSN